MEKESTEVWITKKIGIKLEHLEKKNEEVSRSKSTWKIKGSVLTVMEVFVN